MSNKKESKAKSTKVMTTQEELKKEGGTPKPEIRHALGIDIKIIPKAGFFLNLIGRGQPIVGEKFLLMTKLVNLGSDVIPELEDMLKADIYWGGLISSPIEKLTIPKLESHKPQIFKHLLMPPESGGAWVDYTTSSNVLELWKAYEIKAGENKGKYDLEKPESGDIQFSFYIKSKEEIAQMVLIWLTSALILVAVSQIFLLIL